jgi:hypothetical protein
LGLPKRKKIGKRVKDAEKKRNEINKEKGSKKKVFIFDF